MSMPLSGGGASPPSKELQPIQGAKAEITPKLDWWGEFKHSSAWGSRVIRAAINKDREQFWSEIKYEINNRFNPFPKDKNGKTYFNPKAFGYWAGILILVGGAVSCARIISGHETGNGSGDNGGDGQDGANALCANLVQMAANAHVDTVASQPAWLAATQGNQAQLNTELNCNGGAVKLSVSEVMPGALPEIGDEVVLVAVTTTGVTAETVTTVPLLAIPVAAIDGDGDGQPDYEVIKYVNPEPKNAWAMAADGNFETVLDEVNLNAGTGQLEPGKTASLKAVKTAEGQWQFIVQVFDDGVSPGKTVVLSQAEVDKLDPTIKWAAQMESRASIDDGSPPFVEGKDISSPSDGVKYGFGAELQAKLVEQGWKMVMDSTGHIAGAFNANDNTCAVTLPDNLLSGSFMGEPNDGTVTYFFPGGGADQEGFWHEIPLPDEGDWRCVAVVAQVGNKLGPEGSELPPNTVALKFVRDNGKGGFDIAPGFLELMWAEGNSAVLEQTDTGLRITVTIPGGMKFVREMAYPSNEISITLPADGPIAELNTRLGTDNFQLRWDGTSAAILNPEGVELAPGLRVFPDGHAEWTHDYNGQPVNEYFLAKLIKPVPDQPGALDLPGYTATAEGKLKPDFYTFTGVDGSPQERRLLSPGELYLDIELNGDPNYNSPADTGAALVGYFQIFGDLVLHRDTAVNKTFYRFDGIKVLAFDHTSGLSPWIRWLTSSIPIWDGINKEWNRGRSTVYAVYPLDTNSSLGVVVFKNKTGDFVARYIDLNPSHPARLNPYYLDHRLYTNPDDAGFPPFEP